METEMTTRVFSSTKIENEASIQRAKAVGEGVAGLIHWTVRVVAGLWARFDAWRRKQEAYAELNSLDDRALHDMGLSRGQIAAVLEGFDVRVPANDGLALGAPANANAPRKVA
jgi:uncharacterized protein YjiS (DUF1127 family)